MIDFSFLSNGNFRVFFFLTVVCGGHEVDEHLQVGTENVLLLPLVSVVERLEQGPSQSRNQLDKKKDKKIRMRWMRDFHEITQFHGEWKGGGNDDGGARSGLRVASVVVCTTFPMDDDTLSGRPSIRATLLRLLVPFYFICIVVCYTFSLVYKLTGCSFCPPSLLLRKKKPTPYPEKFSLSEWIASCPADWIIDPSQPSLPPPRVFFLLLRRRNKRKKLRIYCLSRGANLKVTITQKRREDIHERGSSAQGGDDSCARVPWA